MRSNGAKIQGDIHVVIVGGGFGGFSAARTLGAQGKLRVTLIDQRNYHLFQPLLYQVATAGLSPADIAVPIRSQLARFGNIRVLLGQVHSVDTGSKKVTTDFGEVVYDFLILACGATHSYFGHSEWAPFAPGLKTIEQATEIRRKVLLAFEQAERSEDEVLRKRLLTFVVVGGGPTGVELAGALGEISRHTLRHDFVGIDPSLTRIVLIEAGSRLLSSFPEELARKATRDLENLGVTVWTKSRVSQVNETGVGIGDEFISAGTVIWAAGVEPSPIGRCFSQHLDHMGRVLVDETLRPPGSADVFVIGDMANCLDPASQKPLPGLAPVAIQQGRFAARNILALVKGQNLSAFHYVDKGQMATIGRSKAIATMGRMRVSGMLAWLMWLVVHIYFLVGFRNRFFVVLNWAMSYATYQRGARLVVGGTDSHTK